MRNVEENPSTELSPCVSPTPPVDVTALQINTDGLLTALQLGLSDGALGNHR